MKGHTRDHHWRLPGWLREAPRHIGRAVTRTTEPIIRVAHQGAGAARLKGGKLARRIVFVQQMTGLNRKHIKRSIATMQNGQYQRDADREHGRGYVAQARAMLDQADRDAAAKPAEVKAPEVNPAKPHKPVMVPEHTADKDREAV